MVKTQVATQAMKVVVDTNIVFSAILNTNQLIGRILLSPTQSVSFYSTDLLKEEIDNHKEKLRKVSGYSERELAEISRLVMNRIVFIDLQLIPSELLTQTEYLLHEIDPDDVEFVALTKHLSGKLWSGDIKLQKGLKAKGWNSFISTTELARHIQQY